MEDRLLRDAAVRDVMRLADGYDSTDSAHALEVRKLGEGLKLSKRVRRPQFYHQFFRDFRRPSCQETNPVIISQMSSQLSNRQNNIALTAAAAECLFGKIQDAIKSGRAQGASSNIAKLDRMGW